MSDALYWTRLRWHGTTGIAKMHGTTVTIETQPDLGSGALHALLYTPEIGERQVQRSNRLDWEPMTDDEVAAADRLLRKLTEIKFACSWRDEANLGGTLCGD